MKEDRVQFNIHIEDSKEPETARELDSFLHKIIPTVSTRFEVDPTVSSRPLEVEPFAKTLSIILDTSSITALAVGLSKWLAYRDGRLIISGSEGAQTQINSFQNTANLVETLRNLASISVSAHEMGHQIGISGSGNIVFGGNVVGIEPVDPWPQPGMPRK